MPDPNTIADQPRTTPCALTAQLPALRLPPYPDRPVRIISCLSPTDCPSAAAAALAAAIDRDAPPAWRPYVAGTATTRGHLWLFLHDPDDRLGVIQALEARIGAVILAGKPGFETVPIDTEAAEQELAQRPTTGWPS